MCSSDLEYNNGGKDIVLSRRKLLEAQQRAEAEQVRKSIVPGAVLDGRVTSVLDFGAFVELGGGIQGLVQVSEMSWTRVPSANAVVAPGDQVSVKVVRVDEASGKISLSMKQLMEPPAAPAPSATPAAPDPITPGEVVTGKVERHERFGVFITVAPGRTGLMPLSESGVDRDADVAKAFPIGSDVEVAVLEVDQAGRRIRLSKKAVIHQREQAELREYESRQAAAPASSVGSLADKLREACRRVDLVREDLPAGMTMPELALRYILSHPDVTTIIPGMRRPKHVDANLGVSDGRTLDATLLARLAQIGRAHV